MRTKIGTFLENAANPRTQWITGGSLKNLVIFFDNKIVKAEFFQDPTKLNAFP